MILWMTPIHSIKLAACAALVSFLLPAAHAADGTVLHCFAWTPVKEATDADWQAFYKASDALPQKIHGITKVWYGKLANPLSIVIPESMDNEGYHKLLKGEVLDSKIKRVAREYGMCMEMTDAGVLKAYGQDPYHKVWTDAYSKVRVEGTTTFNILSK